MFNPRFLAYIFCLFGVIDFFSVYLVSAWLEDSASPIIKRISQRLQTITGLSLDPQHAEPLQVSSKTCTSQGLINTPGILSFVFCIDVFLNLKHIKSTSIEQLNMHIPGAYQYPWGNLLCVLCRYVLQFQTKQANYN